MQSKLVLALLLGAVATRDLNLINLADPTAEEIAAKEKELTDSEPDMLLAAALTFGNCADVSCLTELEAAMTQQFEDETSKIKAMIITLQSAVDLATATSPDKDISLFTNKIQADQDYIDFLTAHKDEEAALLDTLKQAVTDQDEDAFNQTKEKLLASDTDELIHNATRLIALLQFQLDNQKGLGVMADQETIDGYEKDLTIYRGLLAKYEGEKAAELKAAEDAAAAKAAAEKAAQEAEEKKRQEEEAEKKRKEEEEKKRLEQEAADKAAAEQAEKDRLAKEAEEQKKREEEEAKNLNNGNEGDNSGDVEGGDGEGSGVGGIVAGVVGGVIVLGAAGYCMYKRKQNATEGGKRDQFIKDSLV